MPLPAKSASDAVGIAPQDGWLGEAAEAEGARRGSGRSRRRTLRGSTRRCRGALRTQDARELARRHLVPRREHAPEGRNDDVEALVRERHVLGVTLDPSTSTPAAAARARPCSKSSGVRSRPTTRAPVAAAGIAALPVPQATSSTSSPCSAADACRELPARRPDQLGNCVESPAPTSPGSSP